MLALVLGSGACVWHDVAAFQALEVTPDAVLACNDMIAAWPGPVTVACSLHADKIQGWLGRAGSERSATTGGNVRQARLCAGLRGDRLPPRGTDGVRIVWPLRSEARARRTRCRQGGAVRNPDG